MMETTFIASGPRADLIKQEFDVLIHQKGRDVLLETALICPCKSESTNQSSACKNCGGAGWVFINPRRTRMVLTAIDAVTEFRPWSEELRGTVNITARVEDFLSHMDKITVIEGESIHNEVLFIKQKGSVAFTYSTYNIKSILYIALFVGDNQLLKRLVLNEDYLITDNIIRFSEQFIQSNNIAFSEGSLSSITIRYKHAPQFHVIEMKRDTMQTFHQNVKQEMNQNMPISAIARRAHYQLTAQNLNGDRLLNNSYKLTCNQKEESVVIQTFNTNYDFYITQGDSFNYSLSIVENGSSIDISGRVYRMQVRDSNQNIVTEFVAPPDINIIAPNIIDLNKSIAQTALFQPGTYSYDLQEQIGAEIQTILSGKFIVILQQTI